MKDEDKIAVDVLSKLYDYCAGLARMAQAKVHMRDTSHDEYLRSKGSYDTLVCVKELILDVKLKLLDKENNN